MACTCVPRAQRTKSTRIWITRKSAAWCRVFPSACRALTRSSSLLSSEAKKVLLTQTARNLPFICLDWFSNSILPGDWDDCKQLVVEHFPNMHTMAMEKFFIPTEICMSEPVCGAEPPTRPPEMELEYLHAKEH